MRFLTDCNLRSVCRKKNNGCASFFFFPVALKETNGIRPGTDAKYTLNAFPGKQFTGYEFLAYFYVSWAIAELELGLPFHKAYALAKQMYEKMRG